MMKKTVKSVITETLGMKHKPCWSVVTPTASPWATRPHIAGSPYYQTFTQNSTKYV